VVQCKRPPLSAERRLSDSQGMTRSKFPGELAAPSIGADNVIGVTKNWAQLERRAIANAKRSKGSEGHLARRACVRTSLEVRMARYGRISPATDEMDQLGCGAIGASLGLDGALIVDEVCGAAAL
jgi:hypothetical protein